MESVFLPNHCKDGSLKKDMLSAKNKPEYEWAFREDVERPDNFIPGNVGRELLY
jgi:hypothetical protein